MSVSRGDWTLEEINEYLQKLKEALLCEGAGYVGSFSVGGHSVSFKSADEIQSEIVWATRKRNELMRMAAGVSRHGYVLPNFSGRCR